MVALPIRQRMRAVPGGQAV